MTGLIGLTGWQSSRAAETSVFVPAEDVPHELTFMQWPVSAQVYDDPDFHFDVQQTIADIANTIADFEPVIMLAAQNHHRTARSMLSSRVELWDVPTEDLWCRDSGPLVAFNGNGERVVSHIQFNGWGGRASHRQDGKIAVAVAERLGFPVISSGLVGEPGGVEQDGYGLLIAHESSWVNDNRNPGLTRNEIEDRLLRAYGAERLVWSPGVWGQDVTDYHIDSLARFVAEGHVLMNLPDDPDPDDPFHQAALESHDAFLAADLTVDVIPDPETSRVSDPDFVASYANYYVCNGAVIAAQFGDRETDAIAQQALATFYPDREVVTLDVDPLGELGGGIHCATQQLPAVPA